MIIGTTTTDGVTKVKTKTTDGVTKAVECACCNTACDPAAPWGPGYDDQPETIQVLDQTLTRIGGCQWVITQCFAENYEIYWTSICNDPFDFYVSVNISLNYLYFGAPSGPEDAGNIIFNTYERTGGDDPAPYGIWTATGEGDPPYTITISPP